MILSEFSLSYTLLMGPNLALPGGKIGLGKRAPDCITTFRTERPGVGRLMATEGLLLLNQGLSLVELVVRVAIAVLALIPMLAMGKFKAYGKHCAYPLILTGQAAYLNFIGLFKNIALTCTSPKAYHIPKGSIAGNHLQL